MNSNSTKLSLKLSPEVAKIMPFIVSAKASGKPQLVQWAKKEYEVASAKARWREEYERGREEREREAKEHRQLRAEQDAFWREFDRIRREAWQAEDRARRYWSNLGFSSAAEDGFLEMQPAHSSQKGSRRLLSEFPKKKGGFNDWGAMVGRNQRWSRHTGLPRGRKPRTFRDLK